MDYSVRTISADNDGVHIEALEWSPGPQDTKLGRIPEHWRFSPRERTVYIHRWILSFLPDIGVRLSSDVPGTFEVFRVGIDVRFDPYLTAQEALDCVADLARRIVE